MPATLQHNGFTSPLVGEVGAQSAPGGGYSSSASGLGPPPSLTLPHKGGGNKQRVRRGWRITAAVVAAIVATVALGGACWIKSLGPVPGLADLELSTQVVDRNGRLRRAEGPWAGRGGWA